VAEVYKPGQDPEIDKILVALADQAWRVIIDSIRRAQAKGKAGSHLIIIIEGVGGGEFRVPVPSFPPHLDPDYGRGYVGEHLGETRPVPPTDAELAEWERERALHWEYVSRLIAEVRRLRGEVNRG